MGKRRSDVGSVPGRPEERGDALRLHRASLRLHRASLRLHRASLRLLELVFQSRDVCGLAFEFLAQRRVSRLRLIRGVVDFCASAEHVATQFVRLFAGRVGASLGVRELASESIGFLARVGFDVADASRLVPGGRPETFGSPSEV